MTATPPPVEPSTLPPSQPSEPRWTQPAAPPEKDERVKAISIELRRLGEPAIAGLEERRIALAAYINGEATSKITAGSAVIPAVTLILSSFALLVTYITSTKGAVFDVRGAIVQGASLAAMSFGIVTYCSIKNRQKRVPVSAGVAAILEHRAS